MIPCPKCGAMMKTTHNRPTKTGWYKRWLCKQCGHAQSLSSPDAADLTAAEIQKRTPTGKRRLADADAITIRLSTDTRRELADRYRVSPELIRQIQQGIAYRDLLPDGFRRPPGPNDPSCERCREWRGLESADPCGMGFPDPVVEGVGFARDCSLYEVA